MAIPRSLNIYPFFFTFRTNNGFKLHELDDIHVMYVEILFQAHFTRPLIITEWQTKSSFISMISSVKMWTVTYHHRQILALLRLETVIFYFFNELNYYSVISRVFYWCVESLSLSPLPTQPPAFSHDLSQVVAILSTLICLFIICHCLALDSQVCDINISI